MHIKTTLFIMFSLVILSLNAAYGNSIQDQAKQEAKIKKESLKVVNKKEVSSKISLNNSSKEELMEIKGVGSKLADELIKGRPYSSWDDVSKVKGIGDAKLKAIKEKASL